MKTLEKSGGVAFIRRIGINLGDKVVDFGWRVGHYSIPTAFVVGETGKVYVEDEPIMEFRDVHLFEIVEGIQKSGFSLGEKHCGRISHDDGLTQGCVLNFKKIKRRNPQFFISIML